MRPATVTACTAVASRVVYTRVRAEKGSKQQLIPSSIRCTGNRVAAALPYLAGAACAVACATVLVPQAALAVELEGARCAPQEVAQVAGFLGLGESQERDPVDPFTLQGVTEKRYRIEELEGEKVVRRRPGVSVQACIKIAPTAQTGGTGRLEAPEESTCRAAEDRTDLKKACRLACKSACTDSLEAYRTTAGAALGFPPSKEALERPAKKCARQCSYECAKEGSPYTFTVNYSGG